MFKQFLKLKDRNEFRKISEVVIYGGLCILGFGLHYKYNMDKIAELQSELEKIKKYKDSL